MREIEVAASAVRTSGSCIARVHQLDGILQHRHHAESEQIHLDDAHVGAVVLVPLDDDAAGHGGGLERHDGIELALADDHAAGMLPEVARQVLDAQPQLGERAHARHVERQPGGGEVAAERLVRVDELEVVHHLRQRVDLLLVERQRLAHLARGAAAAVGDDVGGHRRAEPPVFLVDVLDDALAAIAARQVEVDVGPLAALFRQEPLEQQIHRDRIDRGDAEAVADGAVGRRSAPLHEDVLLPAVVDDVPDDQEVAGEIELLDQIELARDLRARLVVIRAVAIARAGFGDVAEERHLGLAAGHRVLREAVAEIGHRVLRAARPAPPCAASASARSAKSCAIASGDLR